MDLGGSGPSRNCARSLLPFFSAKTLQTRHPQEVLRQIFIVHCQQFTSHCCKSVADWTTIGKLDVSAVVIDMKSVIAASPTKIMATNEEIKHPDCAGNITGRSMLIVCLCMNPVFGQPSTSMWDMPPVYRK